MEVDDQLRELGIELRKPPPPVSPSVAATIGRGRVWASGGPPTLEGKYVDAAKAARASGRENACGAARPASLNWFGDLGWVHRILQVTGSVACAPGLGEQPPVANRASELPLQLWGHDCHHARATIGVGELRFDAPVAIKLVGELAG